jgi:hypothetical protein
VLSRIRWHDAVLRAKRYHFRRGTKARSLSSHAQLVAGLERDGLLKARYVLKETAGEPCAHKGIEVPK